MTTMPTMPTDYSGLICYIFLGFCSLIVVMQLIPSLVMMYEMIKSVLITNTVESKS